MWLDGSCHCGAVRFRVHAPHPVPFARCYCSICRKTAGGGGYAINIGADNSTLTVEGRDAISVYRARTGPDEASRSPGQRHFCAHCGSALWVWDPRWPELVHPAASAIDTPLPAAPHHLYLMIGSAAPWVPLEPGPRDDVATAYPDCSLAEWHQRNGLESFE